MRVERLTIDLDQDLRRSGYVGVPIPIELLAEALQRARKDAFELCLTICETISDRHATMGFQERAIGVADVKAAILDQLGPT